MSDHQCFDFRERFIAEGADVVGERCGRCGAIRMESDGGRPMAWFIDPTNPTGMRYAYPDPHNGPGYPRPKDHGPWTPGPASREGIYVLETECGYRCGSKHPYGFVPEAGCPIHDQP